MSTPTFHVSPTGADCPKSPPKAKLQEAEIVNPVEGNTIAAAKKALSRQESDSAYGTLEGKLTNNLTDFETKAAKGKADFPEEMDWSDFEEDALDLKSNLATARIAKKVKSVNASPLFQRTSSGNSHVLDEEIDWGSEADDDFIGFDKFDLPTTLAALSRVSSNGSDCFIFETSGGETTDTDSDDNYANGVSGAVVPKQVPVARKPLSALEKTLPKVQDLPLLEGLIFHFEPNWNGAVQDKGSVFNNHIIETDTGECLESDVEKLLSLAIRSLQESDDLDFKDELARSKKFSKDGRIHAKVVKGLHQLEDYDELEISENRIGLYVMKKVAHITVAFLKSETEYDKAYHIFFESTASGWIFHSVDKL